MKNSKKQKILFCAMIFMLAVIVTALIFKLFKAPNEGYQSFIGIACEAQSCTEQNGKVYLTIIVESYGDRAEKTIRVSDDIKEELLSVDDMDEIIGVNIIFTLSEETIKEDHIDTDKLNSIEYLMYSEQYDEEFLIVGISINE
ncbi:MAG: hypothetical protein LUH58_04620 [Lachnospiraceae bacterium]|nr:hypothetical protein [Lachnospiraceae bacterium]